MHFNVKMSNLSHLHLFQVFLSLYLNGIPILAKKDLFLLLISLEYDGDVLFAQAAIFFVAGRETTITTMTCALFELAKQPQMQKRLREEILKEIQDSNGVMYEAIQNMKYLHQVINETL